jgi:hypothetical protein
MRQKPCRMPAPAGRLADDPVEFVEDAAGVACLALLVRDPQALLAQLKPFRLPHRRGRPPKSG